jgi:diacylglycerol kinase (ATP)
MLVPTPPESPHKGTRGLRRLINALCYSLSGLKLAYRHESAFRQEIALALTLIPLACVLQVAAVERVLLIGSVLLVLVVELLNSSIEAAIDRIGFDTHRLSKRAKDLGSAAVLMALLGLATTWGVLGVPEMIARVRTLWDEMPHRSLGLAVDLLPPTDMARHRKSKTSPQDGSENRRGARLPMCTAGNVRSLETDMMLEGVAITHDCSRHLRTAETHEAHERETYIFNTLERP